MKTPGPPAARAWARPAGFWAGCPWRGRCASPSATRVIVTYILKALVDSVAGTLMTTDTAAWFGEFSSTPFSVVPYHIIVVVGTLLTLYSGRPQH